MRFELTDEQTGFAAAITDLMRDADSVAVARAGAQGDTAPGEALWKKLADLGLTALVATEDSGGLGGSLVDLVVAFEVLGHELAVGPWIESAAPTFAADVGTSPRAAPNTSGRAKSSAIRASASWCLSAW
jgi:alkylation response protein AidB-like acyl-CoA dehydrogenase